MTARQLHRASSVWPSGSDPVLVSDTTLEETGWQERALCAQTDPEAFFPMKGQPSGPAKKVCRRCDVRAECLEDALQRNERFGVWGGLSERERRKLLRQREKETA